MEFLIHQNQIFKQIYKDLFIIKKYIYIQEYFSQIQSYYKFRNHKNYSKRILQKIFD